MLPYALDFFCWRFLLCSKDDSDLSLEALFNLDPALDSPSYPAEFRRFSELLQLRRLELQAYSDEFFDLIPKLLRHSDLRPPVDLLHRLELLGSDFFFAREYALAAQSMAVDKLGEFKEVKDAMRRSSDQFSTIERLKAAVSSAEEKVLTLKRELALAELDLLSKQQQLGDLTATHGDLASYRSRLFTLNSQIAKYRDESEEWKQKARDSDYLHAQLNAYFLDFSL